VSARKGACPLLHGLRHARAPAIPLPLNLEILTMKCRRLGPAKPAPDPLNLATFLPDYEPIEGNELLVSVTLTNGVCFLGTLEEINPNETATLLQVGSRHWVTFRVSDVVSVAWASGYI
jgi:hypothetical protein